MIAIVISEKGGAERRERYEQHEITIGRVKGNDVLLPKGNVSKRHARLIFRDGRYIVTDLKSTNGTYVNHRRITHATLVREGDRIYIGDFVLRIEGGSRISSERPSTIDAPDSSTSNSGSSYRAAPPLGFGGTLTSRPEEPQHPDVVSHFPIEHDPDDSHPSLDVPGPPRVPSGFKPTPTTGSTPSVSTPDPQTSDSFMSARGSNPGTLSVPAVSSEPVSPSQFRSSHPDADVKLREQQQEAVDQLIAALEAKFGIEALAAVEIAPPLARKIEEAIEQEIDAMPSPLPGNLDKQVLHETARAELLELGPIGPLLEDENISHVQVMLRQVQVHRRGRRVRYEGLSFGSEHGVARTLARLCAGAGVKAAQEGYIEAMLGADRELFAVRPPASPDGHLIIVKRTLRSAASLDSLVRSGAISRGMATLLSHCVMARANILVTGAPERGADQLVDALAAAVPKSHHALWLAEPGRPLPDGVPKITLEGESAARCAAIAAATKLGSDHLVVPPLAGAELGTLLDAVTRGAQGVIAGATSETLRQAVDRMSADLAATRPGVTPQTAREWIGAAFDLGLEMTQLRDGRRRVVRLVEFRSGQEGISMRDIFTFAYHRTAAGGSIEGAFYASGTVPRIVEDLAARGMPLDQSIFRRHPSG